MKVNFLESFNNGEVVWVEQVAQDLEVTKIEARRYLNRLVKKGIAKVSRQPVIDERDWHSRTINVNFYWKADKETPEFFPAVF
jgi:predicted ArsR family transcriptional regulator